MTQNSITNAQTNAPINIEALAQTLSRYSVDFDLKLLGQRIELDFSSALIDNAEGIGLQVEMEAELERSFGISHVNGKISASGTVQVDENNQISFQIDANGSAGGGVELFDYEIEGEAEVITCQISGTVDRKDGEFSINVTKNGCEPGSELGQAIDAVKRGLEYNPHAGEDMSNTSNDGSNHTSPSELPINDTVVNSNDFHTDESPVEPVRGRDDSDWEAPGANDTDTNDGTIDGEGGGPPPLADIDWDSLEQTASNGDQASDVIYDADLEQTPPTTSGDLLAGGSPDDAFAHPEPPESSFIDDLGDTLEDIGDAIESAWEDRGAQAVGAAASASFMTYANLNGWTEEDWLDESHEQSIASFVVNEVAQDIVTFDFSAGDYNLFEWSGVNANGDAVAGTGANMIASLAAGEIASELGLGGTDLASTVGTSMAVAGMQYTISTISTGADFALGSTTLTQGGTGMVGSIASAGAGAIGSWAASQVLHSATEAEAIGVAAGGVFGSIVGSAFLPPLGTAVGAYLGSAIGDTAGEIYNEIGDFDLEDITDWGDLAHQVVFGSVNAILGMDEKPKPPVAEVTYSFNPETGVYEQSASHAHHGGKVSHVDGAAGQVADIAGSLLDRLTQGEAQLANRHEMPDIRIGYRGDHQYVMVDGEYIGSEINGENIQAAVGAILGDAVIEGGTALNNHLLYSDDLSDGERFAMMTDPVLTQVTQYHHNEAHQAQTDARLGVREEALDLMDQLDIDQAAFNTAAQNVQSLSAQLSQLSYPTARDDNPTQNQIKAYNAQKTSLEGRLDTAREVLSDAKQTLNATQSEAEPHFRAEHQSEFDQLQTQRSAVIGTDPFDALLARYDALQADQAALGDQRASVSSASLEASRLISAEQNSRDPSPSRIGQLQDRKAQYSSRLDDLSDQADVLTAEMDALFTDYLAALSAPLETELAELKASLAEHATLMTAQAEGTAEVATLENGASFSAEDIAAFNATKESLLNNQITALEQKLLGLEGLDNSVASNALQQQSDVVAQLDGMMGEISGHLAQQPLPAPESFAFDQSLRVSLDALEAGETVNGLDSDAMMALGDAHSLDNATCLDYEIRNHNRTHEAEASFNLYESDLSDLVFVTEGESLTIYNRRLDGADAPLSELPKIVLNDFGQWQDDGINLKFSNREGETVKLSFSIGGILSSFGLNGDGTVDVAQVLAEMHTERTGEPMSLEDAQALRFGHFGQMDAEGNWVGSGGDDLIHASAAIVDAGSGNDTITQSEQATHTDGGSGNDTISYDGSSAGVNVDLAAGTGTSGDAQGDTYINVENVIGSAHADTLVGNDADNVLNGGAGNDTLSGGGGADTLIGGEGVDTADYAASDKGVRVSLSQTVDGVEVAGLGRGGDAEGDRLSGIENAVGSAGDDVIHGNAGDNVLSGGAGNDTLSGGAGNDILEGGEGNDRLLGGAGDDTLVGGSGNDMLISGDGNDRIELGSGNDVVLTGRGDDVIELSQASASADGSRTKKQINGGEGHDQVILQGNVDDYEIYQSGDGYRLRSALEDIHLTNVEAVYFADMNGAELELEHLHHLKVLAQVAEEEAEEEALDARRTSGFKATSGISAAALSAMMAQAAAAEALDAEDSQDEAEAESSGSTLAEWLAGARSEEPETVNAPVVSDADAEESSAAPINAASVVTDAPDETEETEAPVILAEDVAEPTNDTAAEVVARVAQPSEDEPAVAANEGEPIEAETETEAEASAASIAPLVRTEPATLSEDGSAPLGIVVSGQNANETLTIYISGIPSDARIDQGVLLSDGRWQLDQSELAEARLYPGAHNDADLTLGVLVVSYDVDTQQTTSSEASHGFIVEAVADAPTLSVAAAQGAEDTAIALNIASALNDTDGSEAHHIVISNVPATAVLSNGERQSDGTWRLTPDQLARLTITPPADSGDDFSLTVRSYATEGENGDVAETVETLAVTVNAVADAPNLSVLDAVGLEDNPIALNIVSALNDTDGSEAHHIVISNVPVTAVLSNGERQADGTWRLTPDQLAGLTITPPANSDVDFNLTVSSYATEGENGDVAETVETLAVTVNAVADAPNLSVLDAVGLEDNPIALNIVSALNDTDGSEAHHIVVSNVPATAVLSNGERQSDGTWRLTPDQLAELTITPPANSDVDFNLTITSYATEGENSNEITTQAPLAVTVHGVADAPDLLVNPAQGDEDKAIDLSIESTLTDADGSESLLVIVQGVPAGASLSHGVLQDDGNYHLQASDLARLQFHPTPNSDEDVTLTVVAQTTDLDSGSVAETAFNLPIRLHAVADQATLSVAAAQGDEDTAIALNITSTLNDTDGSEAHHIVISNVPVTAVLSNGERQADGTWRLAPDELEGLTITPPANSDVDFNLTVSSYATEDENGDVAETVETLAVTVNAVADQATLSVAAAEGDEDTAIALNITSTLNDTDGSETHHIVISNVPVTAVLSNGERQADGTWRLAPDQLAGLTITPPANSDVNFNLTVTSYATEGENGDVAETVETLAVTVNAVADQATLSVAAAQGDEDTAIALNITSTLNDTDGSEAHHIVISNVPVTAVLSHGERQADGTWRLTPDQLEGLTITPPANSDVNFNLTVSSYATEGENGDVAETVETLAVTVNAVADQATLSVAVAQGDEDTAIALNITSTLNDTDGSETHHIVISNVPVTAVLSHGERQADGTWRLTPDQLEGLTITPPANSDVNFNLTVSSYATEGENGDVAETVETLAVTVNAVADQATLSVAVAQGDEDTAIALNITSTLNDTDGSEINYVVISGVPYGAVLNHGEQLSDEEGNLLPEWALTPDQLVGLTITPPENSSADFNLTVTSYTTEDENGDVAETVETLAVQVNAVLDELSVTFAEDATAKQALTYVQESEYLGTDQSEVIRGDGADNVIKSDAFWQVPIDISAIAQSGESIDWDNVSVSSTVGAPLLHLEGGQYFLLFEKDELSSVMGKPLSVSLSMSHQTVDADGGEPLTDTTTVSLTLAVPPTFGSAGDTVYAGAGDDAVDGGRSADDLRGEAGNDRLFGHAGNDEIHGGVGTDTLYGGEGSDTLYGGSGADVLDGGTGDDVLYADLADLASGGIDGGTGSDTVQLSESGTVNLERVSNVESVVLGSGDDTLNLTAERLTANEGLQVEAGEGNDRLNYSGGGDGFSDSQFSGFESVNVALDSGSALNLSEADFWEGSTISGSSGQDALNITEAGTYDLTGVDWGTIEFVTSAVSDGTAAVKIDEAVDLSRFSGNATSGSVDRIIGVGNSAALTIDMSRADFAAALKAGTHALDKVDNGVDTLIDNGVDTLTFNGTRIELENIDSLTFNDGSEIYLDERNNAAILTTDEPISAGSGDEDEWQMFDDSEILQHYYDIEEDSLTLDVGTVSNSEYRTVRDFHAYTTPHPIYEGMNSTAFDYSKTTFKPDENYYGNVSIDYAVSDGVDSTKGNASYIINSVNDVPVIELVSYEYDASGDYTKGTLSDRYVFKISDIDDDPSTLTLSFDGKDGVKRIERLQPLEDTLSHEILYAIHSTGIYSTWKKDGGLNKSSYRVHAYNHDEFITYVTDSSNDSTFIKVGRDETKQHKKYPIFLDLNGDGFHALQTYAFDYDSDGVLESGTWLANASDAVLAVDYDGDGVVTHGHEVAFADWHPDAATDLEGLQLAFDTNQDGVLNANDDMWWSFGAWQDRNNNGITDSGEFLDMEAMGIVAFHLDSDGVEQSGEGYHVFGQGQFEYADGTFGTFADTALSYTEQPETVDDAAEAETTNSNASSTATAEVASEPETPLMTPEEEDAAIAEQMAQLLQWQQQSAASALSDSEAAVLIDAEQEEALVEVM